MKDSFGTVQKSKSRLKKERAYTRSRNKKKLRSMKQSSPSLEEIMFDLYVEEVDRAVYEKYGDTTKVNEILELFWDGVTLDNNLDEEE